MFAALIGWTSYCRAPKCFARGHILHDWNMDEKRALPQKAHDPLPTAAPARKDTTWRLTMHEAQQPEAARNARDVVRVIAALIGCAVALAACPATAGALPPGVRIVKVRGIRLTYRVSGSGLPLLLVNGSGATLDTWDPLLLSRLSAGRRVIVFDPRGMGASTDTNTDRLTVQKMADDAASLLGALRIKHADVLGWSLGGFVAQALAIRHPAEVRRLVLASTSAGGRTATLATREVQRIDDKTTLGLATPDEFLPILFPPAAQDAGKAWISRLLAQPGGCCEPFSREAGRRQIAAEHRWYQPNGGSYSYLGMIKARTLIAAGALDRDIPAANARLLHRKIHGSKLLVYKDAGHAFLIQHATQFAAAVLGFLRRT